MVGSPSVYGRGNRRLEELWQCRRNTFGARTARGAGTGANGPSGGPSQNNRSGKPRKRRISKKQQAIYRRRRIVAGTVLLLIIALIVFCVYSLGRGIGAVNSMIHHDEVYAISRDATPAPKSQQRRGLLGQ